VKKLLALVCLSTALGSIAAIPPAARASGLFTVTNLVTDDQTVNSAQTTDTSLKNAWGISASPSSPFWVSDNGTGKSTIYQVDPTTNTTTKLGLEMTIPGGVTGQAYNDAASQFNGDRFLFASEDGTLAGWRSSLGTNAEVLQLASDSNVYKGAALASSGGHSYLYAANFRAGTIDVLKGDAGAPFLAGNFTDPNLPSGYAPFNIALLGGKLYVSYAVQDPSKLDDIAGPGSGIVTAFDVEGNLLARVATGGTLNSPWGMALAPASFGTLAGDLLVGNFGDGTISAFDLDPINGGFVEQLTGTDNHPIAIDGLWGLIAGNDGSAGSSQSIYFSAGPGSEAHGLFGVIAPVPEPTTTALLGVGLASLALARRRRPA
jgi:uncharacterized protein (TIGR03118 family)